MALVRDLLGHYQVPGLITDEDILLAAERILHGRLLRLAQLTKPEDSADFLRVRLAPRLHEVFACVFLDNRHRVLAFEELFTGSIDGCQVHPREVVRRCLHLNAAAVILAHNHPSGDPEPGAADRAVTRRLREALELIDVRVLDHFVVANGRTVSLAQMGWI